MKPSNSLKWNKLNNRDLIRDGVLEIGDGYRAKNSELDLSGLPFARAGNIRDGFQFSKADLLCKKSVIRAGDKVSRVDDVVITTKGTFGRVAYVREDTEKFVYSPQLCFWRVKDQSILCPKFLYYWIQSEDFLSQAFQVKSSTDMADYASLKDQRAMSITAPDLHIQRKIAAILTSYDDLIENNKRRIALLEKMAEEIYREWFVRMRFPGHEKAKFKKGVPGDWEVVKFGQIAKFTMGQSPKSEFYNEVGEGLPFNQGVGTFGVRFPIKKTYCATAGRKAKQGDILFSVRAPVGRLNIADCEMIIGRGLAAIRHNDRLNSYLFYLLKTVFTNEDIIGNGAIFNSVGKDELGNFKIFRPNTEIVFKFNQIAKDIDSEIALLFKSLESLESSRDLLLPRLISGKLPVDNLDIHFPPSMQPPEDKAHA